jgi:AAA15 family ATPase/GTPase
MRIKKLQLKNGYKRFFDLTIDLGDDPRRIIALVGPNGCGKSSVLDGLLFHASAHGPIGNKGQKDYEYHSMTGAPDYNWTNVSIDFVEGNYQAIRAEKQKTGKEKTIFSFRSPYRYNSKLKINQSVSVPDIRLNDYGASTACDLDDKIEQNYRRLYVKYNKYMHDNDYTPSHTKQLIIGELNSSIKACLDLEISSIGSIEDSKGTLYFKKNGHPKEFDFNVLSSGEKEVVDILLDLYLRRNEFDDTVFLLDEPELHINTGIQRKLLIEINHLIGPNCQLWVTTHSIGFLRALQDEFKDDCQIIQFPSHVNLASTAQILRPMPKTAAKWKEIFSVALDDLTNLVSPKNIFYCEGRDMPGQHGEEKGLDAKVFNNIFSEKYHDTLFISSGGSTELDQRSEIALAILSKVFSEVGIFVVKDRDMSSGKPNTEHDRQIYLSNNPKSHRVLKRWEIENYLYDKEVLRKFCTLNQLTFDESGYDLFVKNIEDQNVKDETNRIKNLCGITTSISSEQFKLNLSTCITPDMAVFRELEECIFERM